MNTEPLVLSDESGETHCFMNGHTFIVNELCEGGSLSEQILKRKSYSEILSDEETTRSHFRQIFEGVNYLHSKHHLAHLNLSLRQVYVNAEGQAKISGFANV